MSFLSDLAADLKASVSKSATNLYTATLDKAQDAANSLFKKAAVGDIADLKNQTIPAAASPQNVGIPQTTAPAAPISPAPALITPAGDQESYISRLILGVLAIAALVYFLRD